MTKDDVDAVYKVEEDCFVDPWSKDSIRKELKNDLARYLVAEVDNKIVGYIGIWFVVDEGHITNVAVHSNYRGKKILIDCGEGTQVSMRMKNCGFKDVDLILITHLSLF